MVQNLGRKTLLIVLLLVGAVLSLVLPDQPFRMGLDLEGGSRLVYKIDWDKALAEGKVNEQDLTDKHALLQEMIGIIRNRVDPLGTLEASFSPQGDDRIVIEIPSTANVAGAQAEGTLTQAITGIDSSLALTTPDAAALDAFPQTGGVIAVNSEKMRYGARDGNVLRDLRRGLSGTKAVSHEANSLVELKDDDPIRSLIENPGTMKLYIAAQPGDTAFAQAQTDYTTEQQKADTWRKDNPGVSITTYNQELAKRQGLERLRVFPRRIIDKQGKASGQEPLVLLWDQPAEWTFRGEDLHNINKSQDNLGFPAVALAMKTSKEFAFGDFTQANKGRGMAIVLNDVIVTLANIKNRLPGNFIIEGGQDGFTSAEVEEMIRVLRSGSLIVRPEIEQAEKVGAKLGDEYVRQGFMSAVLGLALVLGFMMLYYRKLGVFAAISLLAALIMLLGAMAFTRATMTLPGVAGIILTVGMAVDANILIYERIREELQRGRKLAQACEDGFSKAFVTIVDANLTTFITAFVLYQIGTGPVRGFATTLMIGIVTSVFAALVITKVLVQVSLQRGATTFKMAQAVRETHVGFMGLAKICGTVSGLLIIGSVILWTAEPAHTKLGIEFVGGLTATVRTEEPQKVDTIRERIAGIEGDIGESAEVVELRAAGNETDGYRAFRITYKSLVDVNEQKEAGAESTGQDDIHKALEDLLQRGPVEATFDGKGGVKGRLYLEESHQTADLQSIVADGGFGTVTMTPVAGHDGAYEFTTSTAPTENESKLVSSITNLFQNKKDAAGADILLAEPMPELSVVGAQVVGELRDSAIIAIVISLFLVVMYIRARFAEYSYGLAAVAALIHDVLITLGALAVANETKLLNAEISLPMIAAFLTIIGYSLNDTIVVFDRIRENRPRMNAPLSEILDVSINQTLSRTLLTSMTTFLAVIVLLVFNYGSGSVLEGFAFALGFGVVVGTYSSIFIASPALLFFERRDERKRGGKVAKSAAAAGN
ncbi:MAG: protein translocase subunit SecD [Planctomycetes bacterium]|nr:protein translocase subunit SecD [Planctomycetota bacterium]